MNTALLMVTHYKDAAWAYHSLRTIEKNCTGFSDVVVAVPAGDMDLFWRLTDFRVVGYPDTKDCGMVAHMAQKCCADVICSGADAIVHLDADTMFWNPTTPADFFTNGKPIMYREKYEDFRERHPTRYGWKATVTAATGIDPVYETMVRHCSIHLRETYEKTRRLIETHTGKIWSEYILSCENSYPQGFAEFPVLGAVALEHFADRYHWVDYDNAGLDYEYEKWRDPVVACWSHGGLDAITDRHPGRTAREVIEEILK